MESSGRQQFIKKSIVSVLFISDVERDPALCIKEMDEPKES